MNKWLFWCLVVICLVHILVLWCLGFLVMVGGRVNVICFLGVLAIME